MSVEEKIARCARVIYNTHELLSRKSRELSRETRVRSIKVLQEASRQLEKIIRSGIV